MEDEKGQAEEGFVVKPAGAGVKTVGPQGVSGQGLGGAPCDYAGMPISGGKVPHKMAGGMSVAQQMAPQNGVMPKVGK